VTSRDHITRFGRPTAPYFDHRLVRFRSRIGIEDNKTIVVHVRDNKQLATYIDNYQVTKCKNIPLDPR
jgi:hypothetical protein